MKAIDVIQAVLHAIDEKRDYDKARREFDGCSWDWSGRLFDKLSASIDEADKALAEYVDERIAAALALCEGE